MLEFKNVLYMITLKLFEEIQEVGKTKPRDSIELTKENVLIDAVK